MKTVTSSAQTPASRVQRVLARFELACPSLRDFQITVEVAGKGADVVVLPAAARPKGRIEFVFTPRGGLRTCLYPTNLSGTQLASVEDLAWALREALGAAAPAAPPAPAPAEPSVEPNAPSRG